MGPMMGATDRRLRVLEQHVASGPHQRRPPTQPPPKPAAASAPTPPPIAFLKGCRVVELANWIAAPAASAMLADYGADVIKGLRSHPSLAPFPASPFLLRC